MKRAVDSQEEILSVLQKKSTALAVGKQLNHIWFNGTQIIISSFVQSWLKYMNTIFYINI